MLLRQAARVDAVRRWLAPSNIDQQVPELVLGDLVARFDDGRAVELLQDRRPLEGRVERQLLAGIDRCLAPAIGEPDATLANLRGLERRCAFGGGEGCERTLRPHP